jgi:hypothetical protein
MIVILIKLKEFLLYETEKKITLKQILEENNLDLIKNVMTKDYCFGCTA